MNKGRRYDADRELNIKKVIAVIIAFAVIIMFIVGLIKLLKTNPKDDEKIISIDYYSVYTNGKWGVINSKGETIIEPAYEEMIQIPDKTKEVFICIYDVDYNTNTYKSKAVNEKNETIFTQYDMVEVISNMDENNNLLTEKDILKVKKNGKNGIINIEGKEIVPCEYEDIYELNGVKNSLITVKNGKKGLTDTKGNIIIGNEYKDIGSLTSKYENGYIVQNNAGKFGVISYNKKIELECKYEKVKNVFGSSNSSNFYVVKEDGKLKVVDNQGNNYLEDKYSDILSINDNNIVAELDNKVGIVTKLGEQMIPFEYQELTYLYSNNYIAKKDDLYGVVNLDNEVKLDLKYTNLIYRQTADFLEGTKNNDIESDLISHDLQVKMTGIVSEVNIDKGYMKVRKNNEYKYYTFKFEEKKQEEVLKSNTLFLSKSDENGKYGFVNKDGVVVVNYIYDDATEQDEYGFSSIKKDGKWGAIDQTGAVIVEPEYSLDNNLVIKFIGKWHLAQDLNANYYTDSE